MCIRDSDDVPLAPCLEYVAAEMLPSIRKQARHVVVQPSGLGSPRGGHRVENNLGYTRRISLGVGEGKRRSPRAARDEPPIDTEVLSQRLDISDQVIGRIDLHVRLGVTRMRRRTPAAALIEKDDSVPAGIECASHVRRAPLSGASVQNNGWLPGASA